MQAEYDKTILKSIFKLGYKQFGMANCISYSLIDACFAKYQLMLSS